MKTKKFSRKLLALFLAIVMALSSFAGVLTAFAETSANTEYHEDALSYNSLGWAILDDEQTCTAVLDFLDNMLAEMDMDDMVLDLSILGSITIRLKSVDQLLQTVTDLENFLNGKSALLLLAGDARYVDLSATKDMQRSNTSSTDIVRGLVKLVRNLASASGPEGANGNIVKKLLRGEMGLGIVGSFIDLYNTIGDLLGMSDGYESNMVYNIVQQLILEYTGWFTAEEKANIRAHHADDGDTYKLDTVLMEKLSTQLLQNITVQVTYADKSNSQQRYAEYMKNGSAPYIDMDNLHYVTEEDSKVNGETVGNVYLFRYQDQKLSLAPTDNLFEFAYKAFQMAWQTVLKDTLGQLNSNTGAYDYNYYMWYTGEKKATWNYSDIAANYADADVKAWAAYECTTAAANLKEGETLGDQYADATAYLDYIKNDLDLNRELVEDPTYTWRDIDSTTLFNKLRYSPLADLYFNVQTGPLNCSFAQTGTKNINAFMDNQYQNYNSMVAALNDFLVAAVADFLPQGTNTGTYSALKTVNSDDPATVSETIIDNAMVVLQYVADQTDKNILSAFYHSGKTTLDATNLEEAMIPFAISALRNIPDFKKGIHNADLDACQDAEGVAALALQLYLSYVMPEKDYSSLLTKTDGKYTVSLDNILLMARDAVGYVMSPYVPLHDKNGNLWDPMTATLTDGVSLFDLLNSVVVYYAGEDTFADGEPAKAVANLLGVCDQNGNCLVKLSNDLWTNLDAIINKLLPAVGTLQYGNASYKGQASSYDLIYNDVIKGMLNVAETHENGLDGISNFINKLLTFVSAPPIKSTAVIKTVYDVLADLVNAIFGARYSDRTYATVVPAEATNNHPFYDLLQKDTFAGSSSNSSLGVLGSLVYNVYEASGGVGGDSGRKDTVMPGLMYVVQAVNSLAGGFITTLADHNMKLASARIAESNAVLKDPGSPYSTTLIVNNNCYGINRGVKDASGNYVARGRYNIEVTGIVSDNDACTVSTVDTVIQPEKSASFDVEYTGMDTDTVVRYTVTYNIIDTNTNQVMYSGLTCSAYQFISMDKNWKDSAYPGGAQDSSFSDNSNKSTSDGNASVKVSGSFGSSYLLYGNPLRVSYPADIVVSTSDLSAIENYTVRFSHTGTVAGYPDRTMDGMYCYTSGTVYDDVTGKNVTVNESNMMACFDKATGDVLNYNLLDYSTDGGATWTRGVTRFDVPAGAVTRVNHAYTLQELIDNGNLAAAHAENGVYQYVYLKSGNVAYSTLLGTVSGATGVDGIYIQTGQKTLSKDSSTAMDFLRYDGTTDVPYIQEQAINVCFYSSAKSATGSLNLTVVDDGDRTAFDNAYSALQDYITNYRPTDFSDCVDGESETYNRALAALAAGYGAERSPVLTYTAETLSNTYEKVAVTSEVQSIMGEKATKLATSTDGMQASMKAYVTESGGYYYADADCSQPIYTTTALADSDVISTGTITVDGASYSTGTNALGVNVVKVDGTWYLLNDQAYTMKWDTTSYDAPYQVQDKAKDGTYNQVQFAYVNAYGYDVDAASCAYKYPVTKTEIAANDGTENRAIVAQAKDTMLYALDECAKYLSVTVAGQIFDNVSNLRDGLVSANFSLPEYQKALDLAKDAESLYHVDIYLTSDMTEPVATCAWNAVDDTIAGLISKSETPTTAADYTTAYAADSSSLQIDEAIRVYQLYMQSVIERGYIGDKLQAEILCAGGNSYDVMTTSWTAAPTEADPDAQNATVSTTATTCAYGSVVNGQIVNQDENGKAIYTEESWQNYINALAAAVDIATTGNGDYAYKNAGVYNTADKAGYTANLSAIFTAKNNLVDAENELEAAPAATGYEVTGKVLALANTSGKLAGDDYGIRECDVLIDGVVVATTNDDGVFTIPELAAGTYTATLSYAYGYDREVTITVTDGAVDLGSIGMVACNFSKDGRIDGTDYNTYKRTSGKSSSSATYNPYCDFNHDGSVNGTDYNIYKAFSGKNLTNIYN